MFFCEYCEIFKSTYFEEHLRRVAFGVVYSKQSCSPKILTLIVLPAVAPNDPASQTISVLILFVNTKSFLVFTSRAINGCVPNVGCLNDAPVFIALAYIFSSPLYVFHINCTQFLWLFINTIVNFVLEFNDLAAWTRATFDGSKVFIKRRNKQQQLSDS